MYRLIHPCTFGGFDILCKRLCNCTVQFFIVISRWIILETAKKDSL